MRRLKVQSQTYDVEEPSNIQQSSKFLGSVATSVSAASAWSPEKAVQAQRNLAYLPSKDQLGSRVSRQETFAGHDQLNSERNEFTHKGKQNSIDERQSEVYGLKPNQKKPLLLNYPIKEIQRRGTHQNKGYLNREEMQYGHYQSAQEIYLP